VSEEIAERIRATIRERGPITFAEFMEHALYGPGGFYEQPPVGVRGHFVTSPHVHPVFSRLVGIALEELWAVLGRPVPLVLVEAGAGDGTLARELFGGFARASIDVSYTAIETSAGARAALSNLAGVNVLERLADAGPIEAGVLFANELLDNLPFRRARRRDRLVEVRVGLQGERLVEVETPWEGALPDTPPTIGEESIVPVGALAFVGELAEALTRGYALLVDYGTETGPGGRFHGYRLHHVLEDVLDDPGSADITTGVDLGAVARRATLLGLRAFGPVPQWAALVALGYEEWAAGELARQTDLLDAGRGLDAVRAWEGRGRARLLVDPGALGRLRWFLLATEGLPPPAWFDRARALRASSD